MKKWMERRKRNRPDREEDTEDDFSLSPQIDGRENPLLLKPIETPQDEESDIQILIDDIDLASSPWAKFNPKYEHTLEKLKNTLDQYARDGDAEKMTAALARRHDLIDHVFRIRESDASMGSPLHVAAKYGQLQCVEVLVKMLEGTGKENVKQLLNGKGESGATPLHLAISGRKQVPIDTKTKIVEYLVNKGADVFKKDDDSQSPIHYATMWGNPEAASILLEKDKRILKDTDKNGLTALQLAITLNRNKVARVIIDNMDTLDDVDGMIRVDDQEQTSSSPLHLACLRGNLEMVDLLLKTAERFVVSETSLEEIVNVKDADGQTPLHVALGNRHFDVARLCIEKGADVSIAGLGKNTALHLAAVAGDTRIVVLLLEKGAIVDEVNDHHATALHLAAVLDNHEICTLLLDWGANLELRNKPDALTPLLVAANAGNPKTITTLLDRDADITATDNNERNAVHLGAETNHPGVIKVVLQCVKENYIEEDELIDSQNFEGNAPLHCAAEKGSVEAVQCLISYKADLSMKNDDHKTPIHLASQNGRKMVVRELIIALPSMVNMEDKHGNTALHLAALAGQHQVVRVLIYKGKANIEARNSNDQTALHIAAREGWTRTCGFLLYRDASVNAEDDQGRTPLHLACQQGKDNVVKLFIHDRKQLDINKKTKNGETCLDLAIKENQRDTALALIMSDRWEECVQSGQDQEEDAPLKKLIINMPEVAKAVLYQCTVKSRDLREGEAEYTFNYKCLDDSSINGMVTNQHHCLRLMMHHDRFDLLSHPLVIALLRHKWLRFGKAFYCINLSIYALFLTVLTVYVLSVAPMAPHHFMNMTELGKYKGIFCEKVQQFARDKGTPVEVPILAKICKYLIMVLCFEQVIRETIQRILASGWVYFASAVHWIEIIIYVTFHIATFLVVVDVEQPCQTETGIRLGWQWQLGSVSLFFGWIHLLLYIRKVPVFGIYAVMFATVFVSFLQFFPVFFLLIVAFALSFYCLLGNQIPFGNEGISLYKTSVMMIGEMEYDGIFHRRDEDDTMWRRDAQIWYGAMTYILFTLFLVVMAVLVMNLLTGLAVGDTTKVQERSRSRTISMQVSYLLDTERLWFKLRQIACLRFKKQPGKGSNSDNYEQIVLRKSNNPFVNNWVLSTSSIFEQCKSVQAWKTEQDVMKEERRKLTDEREAIRDQKDMIKIMNRLERIVGDLDRKMDERMVKVEEKLGRAIPISGSQDSIGSHE
ncbi:transient receptor potential cation channel subfamily A member 1 homolog [Lineus longissimus]|uniref:transient receptor potential cation channel subfamily A member 1 homolog n=1 Tax=Lineus longissimus TaxID=88925 RepID=UPI002B4DB72C